MEPVVDTAVVLFTRGAADARHKRLGLAPAAASRLCRALLGRTLDTLGGLPAQIPVVVLAEAPLAPDDLARLGARPVRQLLQRGAGFEARLLDGLTRVADSGVRRLVVVGSDTPGLTSAELHAAVDADPRCALVGPAHDGGIYLLGITADRLGELRGLPWCTSALCRRLRTRLSARLLSVRRRDVDSAADVTSRRRALERLCRRVLGLALTDAGTPPAAPAPDAADSAPALPVGRAPPAAAIPV